MARPSRRPFPTDLFSSLPQQRKGKERAVEPSSVECTQCRLAMSTAPCIARHSLWCPIRSGSFMRNQVLSRRSHTYPPSSQQCPPRHSSSAARILPSQTHFSDPSPSVRLPPALGEPADNLRSLLTPHSPFDPEHAWHLYTAALQADSANATLTPTEHRHFIQRILDAFELWGDVRPDLPLLRTWATRLEPVLQKLSSNLEADSPEYVSLGCLAAQVLAWSGDIAQASQLARKIQDTMLTQSQRCTLLCVYRNMLVLLRHQETASHALDLLVREWKFLGPFYRARFLPLPQATPFREAIIDLLADVPDGARLLLSRSQEDEHRRSRMGELLLDAYCAKELLHQAHALVLEMRRQQLSVGFHPQIKLTRLLAQHDLFVLAREIFTRIDPLINPRLYHSTGLHLYARCGDTDRAEHFFNKHYDNNWSIPVARRMLMHAYAVTGKVETVVELFHKFFPATSEGDFLAIRPDVLHFSTVVLAYAEIGNVDGINFWLEKMLNAGCRPDSHVYSIILRSFARRGDVDSVAATLDQMRAGGIKPNHVHYTTVVTLLAQRKDAAAAEAFYLRALREGTTPDRIMITSLMNAHVEAGSWEGVIRAFDYLRQSSGLRQSLSIEVYNTLFKAYVFIGSPFRIVLRMFRKLTHAGMRPDGHTYAWIIQSACDAGKMDVAEELFAEMEEKAKAWEPLYHFDAYLLTVIMAGHLRQRSHARAKACYGVIQRRGIKPSSLTYKQVLRAYANDRTEKGLEIAESFLKRIMDADADDSGWAGSESRSTALGNIHSPLMLAYARKEKPEEVARLFNGMLDAGGEPSLASLTIALDVYRRTDNVDAVRQLWSQIWALALRLSSVPELFEGDSTPCIPVARRRSNLLCTPLSIYIDALSAAGEHRAVWDAWSRAKAEGFSFDAHNWNHLAVVLVRAGELDRAFEVLERILIPHARKSPATRDPFPASPLVFDVAAPDVDTPAPDRHGEVRRARAVKTATKAVGSRLAVSEHLIDFAHSLHMLHQIVPGLSVWRPHAVTLQVLSNVLRHLQRGHLVQPVCAPDAPHYCADSRNHVEIANATLRRIYHDYPEAVRTVLLYQRRQARRAAIEWSPRQWIKVKREVVDTLADGDAIELDEQ